MHHTEQKAQRVMYDVTYRPDPAIVNALVEALATQLQLEMLLLLACCSPTHSRQPPFSRLLVLNLCWRRLLINL